MPGISLTSRRGERNFYLAMALFLAAVVFIGFARTFYLGALFPEARDVAAPEPVFKVHGAIATLWFAWLVAQVLLIRRGDYRSHRALGFAGAALAALLIATGLYGASVAVVRPGGFIGLAVPPLQFFAVPFFDLVMFGLFVTWAVLWRSNVQAHKRLILFATINIIDAAVARIPLDVIVGGFPLSIYYGSWIAIAAIVVWDLATLRRIHFVTVVATVLTVAVQFARLAVMGTDGWNAFASWLVGLLQGGVV